MRPSILATLILLALASGLRAQEDERRLVDTQLETVRSSLRQLFGYDENGSRTIAGPQDVVLLDGVVERGSIMTMGGVGYYALPPEKMNAVKGQIGELQQGRFEHLSRAQVAGVSLAVRMEQALEPLTRALYADEPDEMNRARLSLEEGMERARQRAREILFGAMTITSEGAEPTASAPTQPDPSQQDPTDPGMNLLNIPTPGGVDPSILPPPGQTDQPEAKTAGNGSTPVQISADPSRNVIRITAPRSQIRQIWNQLAGINRQMLAASTGFSPLSLPLPSGGSVNLPPLPPGFKFLMRHVSSSDGMGSE